MCKYSCVLPKKFLGNEGTNVMGIIQPVSSLCNISSAQRFTLTVQSDPEGALWRDPPNYWEQIVYPAYVRAHKHLFKDEDIENGDLNPELANELVLLPGEGYGDQTMGMGQMVELSAQRILSVSSP